MRQLFGTADELARTLSALLTFFIFQRLADEFSPLPAWIEFPVGFVVAVLVAGLMSQWLWRPPSITVTWKANNVAHVGPSVRMNTTDLRTQRVWTLEIVRSKSSLLGVFVMKRLQSSEWTLRIDVRPPNVFFLTCDYHTGFTPPAIDQGGFTVSLDDLKEAGPTSTLEIEWEPRANPIRVECGLSYRLTTSLVERKWAPRLVRINQNVTSIELMRGK